MNALTFAALLGAVLISAVPGGARPAPPSWQDLVHRVEDGQPFCNWEPSPDNQNGCLLVDTGNNTGDANPPIQHDCTMLYSRYKHGERKGTQDCGGWNGHWNLVDKQDTCALYVNRVDVKANYKNARIGNDDVANFLEKAITSYGLNQIGPLPVWGSMTCKDEDTPELNLLLMRPKE